MILIQNFACVNSPLRAATRLGSRKVD
ncbi:hypothetical protein EMIT0P74_10107 [Pseudomonas sp. IT-P74]